MPLDISRALRNPGETFPFVHEESIPAQEIIGDIIRFDDPVHLEGTMCITQGDLRVKGRLTATARGSCAKCLNEAIHKVRVDFDETFIQKGEEDLQATDLDLDERLAYDGPQLAVSQLALTLAVLDLPMRLLCREDCEGLDTPPQQDQTHAGQKELPNEHPFSALQQLLNKDQEV